MPTLPVSAKVNLPSVLTGQSNGQLPAAILASIPGQAGGPTIRLVEPAARACRAMLAAAALTAGHVLKATSLNDSYRPYEVQKAIFQQRYTTTNLGGPADKFWNGRSWWLKPGYAVAAVPGTSNHGRGLAVDFGEEKDGDSGVESIDDGTVAWLVANAARYGFSAELQSEKWHWRYYTGDAIPAAVLAFENGEDEMDQATFTKFYKAAIMDPAVQVQERARPWQYVGGGIPAGMSTLAVFNEILTLVRRVAAEVNIDAAELAAITTASQAGAVAAGDQIARAVVAALPEGVVLTEDVVENAVRSVFADAASVD